MGPQGRFAPGPTNSLGGPVYSIANYINYTYTTTTYVYIYIDKNHFNRQYGIVTTKFSFKSFFCPITIALGNLPTTMFLDPVTCRPLQINQSHRSDVIHQKSLSSQNITWY
jgi:hypothetical protein